MMFVADWAIRRLRPVPVTRAGRSVASRRTKRLQRAIIDIDSSGLGSASWPVSVAWRILDTGAEGHLLIKPAPTWHGWQEEAEEIHGISRGRLEREGVSPTEAAHRIAAALAGTEVHSDAPALDQVWLDKIFATASHLAVPALRRYGDLFRGAARREYQALVRQVGEQAADWKALADIRRLATAVRLYEFG